MSLDAAPALRPVGQRRTGILFADLFGTDEMRAIFDDWALLQSWLDAEAALAAAEAEVGVVPVWAAEEIARKARAEFLDLDELRSAIARTDHPLVPTIWALDGLCENGAGAYVHWGATTQDVMDTGMILQLRSASTLFRDRLEALDELLARRTAEERETIMAGRTHGQHALPITFGFKVAGWLAELLRHEERLDEILPRLLVGQLSGAAGTLASLGEDGSAVQRAFCRRLGLGTPPVSWHVARDSLAEYVNLLAMVAATCARIAGEVILLQKTEVGEVEEGQGDESVGSSTMPQKRNPMKAESVVAAGRLVRRTAATALEGMIGQHERDMSAWQAEWAYVPEVCCLTDAALVQTIDLVARLRVDREQMARNLEVSGGLIMAETVMLALARHVGRQRAHDILHPLARRASEERRPFADVLVEAPEAAGPLGGRAAIEALLDPFAYLGVVPEAIDAVLTRLDERRRKR